MTTISIKTKELKTQDNVSQTAPSSLLTNREQELIYMVSALMEATRERELAELRISELAKRAVDTLLHLDNTARKH